MNPSGQSEVTKAVSVKQETFNILFKRIYILLLETYVDKMLGEKKLKESKPEDPIVKEYQANIDAALRDIEKYQEQVTTLLQLENNLP